MLAVCEAAAAGLTGDSRARALHEQGCRCRIPTVPFTYEARSHPSNHYTPAPAPAHARRCTLNSSSSDAGGQRAAHRAAHATMPLSSQAAKCHMCRGWRRQAQTACSRNDGLLLSLCAPRASSSRPTLREMQMHAAGRAGSSHGFHPDCGWVPHWLLVATCPYSSQFLQRAVQLRTAHTNLPQCTGPELHPPMPPSRRANGALAPPPLALRPLPQRYSVGHLPPSAKARPPFQMFMFMPPVICLLPEARRVRALLCPPPPSAVGPHRLHRLCRSCRSPAWP